MKEMLLKEPGIYPSNEVLKHALGKVYDVLEELQTQLTQDEFALTFDWLYYKDSKGWLCKVSYKKKTVFWLSVWDGFFKASFFFLGRHLEGIAALELNEDNYIMEKEWGKMIPFIFNISKHEQISDVLKMVEFKKKAK